MLGISFVVMNNGGTFSVYSRFADQTDQYFVTKYGGTIATGDAIQEAARALGAACQPLPGWAEDLQNLDQACFDDVYQAWIGGRVLAGCSDIIRNGETQNQSHCDELTAHLTSGTQMSAEAIAWVVERVKTGNKG